MLQLRYMIAALYTVITLKKACSLEQSRDRPMLDPPVRGYEEARDGGEAVGSYARSYAGPGSDF